MQSPALRKWGSPIRTSTDLRVRTAPRRISSFATSFFGSWHLGIHRALFLPLFLLVFSLSSCHGSYGTGGPKRDRTADLLLARQALSQLSYGPMSMGLSGLEPPTSPLSGVRSNQLS
jgi:hypothetical protein